MNRREKREAEKEKNYFFEFLKIQRHFFKELVDKLKKVKDKRHQGYIKYLPELILLTVIMKNVCRLKSMRRMTEQFNKYECIENISKMLGIECLDELPHYDTVNDFLEGLPFKELEKIRTYMMKELIKKRCFEDYRLDNKYWCIAFDGTGLFSFKEKHCEHCLRRDITDAKTGEKRTIYMHHVLEAKLIIGDMVFSIGTEFIENESEDVEKQDCELKAFKRLAERIKIEYKRLPICILGDGLYPCEPVFKICDEYKWKYLLRFKEGRIKSIANEFEIIKNIEKSEGENSEETIFWANDVVYNKRLVNLIEAEEDEKKSDQKKRFFFVTNIRITRRLSKEIICFGRSRWKIENQGFNNQKNHMYNIEHLNSYDYNAMKNHYLLVQIADILNQLFRNGLGFLKNLRKTIKEISSNLLEAVRSRRLTNEDISNIDKRTQIRFT